jgi:secreted trypsin-like serine protease
LQFGNKNRELQNALDGTTSDVLNFIKDKLVISNDECSKNYGNIDKSIMCIEGRNNQSICGASCEFNKHTPVDNFYVTEQGDGGGPLIYKESDGKWTQIGIVSFGHKESCIGFPQGFTRVTYYLGWISTKTGLKIAD